MLIRWLVISTFLIEKSLLLAFSTLVTLTLHVAPIRNLSKKLWKFEISKQLEGVWVKIKFESSVPKFNWNGFRIQWKHYEILWINIRVCDILTVHIDFPQIFKIILRTLTIRQKIRPVLNHSFPTGYIPYPMAENIWIF